MSHMDLLSPHLWQSYFALRRGDILHAEEHLRAAMNLADPGPGAGLDLIPAEPCLLTGKNHHLHEGGEQPASQHP